MKWDEAINQKKPSLSLKCGSLKEEIARDKQFFQKLIRENLPYRRSVAADPLLEEIKNGKMFGYVQLGNEVSKNFSSNFANFPPIFKNTLGGKNDSGDSMKKYAQEEGIMFQRRKMLISGYTLQNGTLITPLLLFYFELGLVCTKIH